MVTFAMCISLAKMAPSAQMLWVAINVNAHLDLKAKTVTKVSYCGYDENDFHIECEGTDIAYFLKNELQFACVTSIEGKLLCCFCL